MAAFSLVKARTWLLSASQPTPPSMPSPAGGRAFRQPDAAEHSNLSAERKLWPRARRPMRPRRCSGPSTRRVVLIDIFTSDVPGCACGLTTQPATPSPAVGASLRRGAFLLWAPEPCDRRRAPLLELLAESADGTHRCPASLIAHSFTLGSDGPPGAPSLPTAQGARRRSRRWPKRKLRVSGAKSMVRSQR